MLFHGNPYLIEGFNTFLPPGYHINASADPRDPSLITVTTPLGTMISPLVRPSSCSILKARLAPGAIEPASNFLARSAGPDNCRRIRPRKYE
jgi:histone deacetylase complex regulatory component SIN3